MASPGDPKSAERELAAALREIGDGWDGWANQEAAGRCLRALGRPDEAVIYLRKSLDRPKPGDRPIRWLAQGAVLRLLDEDEAAGESWLRALDAIERAGRPEIERGRFVEAQFLLGHDDAAIEMARQIEHDKIFRGAGVSLLSMARQQGDRELARKGIQWFADRIRHERAKVSATGMVTLHDWHEIATELAEELSSSA